VQYVLSVISSDHPGIVAGVSSAVANLGGNINSCSQTVLDGYFTFITIIDLPKKYVPEELAAEVQNSEGLGNDYQVLVRPIGENSVSEKHNKNSAETFVITAFGKDRGGIVKEFSRFLAGHDININDLYGYKTGDEFVLVGQLTVPEIVNIRNLQDDLEEMGNEFGFTVRLQHNNIFAATNQLRIPE